MSDRRLNATTTWTPRADLAQASNYGPLIVLVKPPNRGNSHFFYIFSLYLKKKAGVFTFRLFYTRPLDGIRPYGLAILLSGFGQHIEQERIMGFFNFWYDTVDAVKGAMSVLVITGRFGGYFRYSLLYQLLNYEK
jgi:hypothetical protein